MTSPLEPTNRPYALAKIAGIELCHAYNRQYGTAYIGAMPTNLYGPNDNYDLENSHVLPALIRKMHEAKRRGDASVTVWGSGTPRREFLHSEDMADACLFLLECESERLAPLFCNEAPPLVNIGCGVDLTIADLARLIKGIVGFEGDLIFDRSKPDGTPRKLIDVSRMRALGWSARINLEDGITSVYQKFCAGQT